MGVDFSQHFVDAANQMKELGEMEYEAHIQGDIHEVRCAKLSECVKPAVVAFQQGDACHLSSSLGMNCFRYKNSSGVRLKFSSLYGYRQI